MAQPWQIAAADAPRTAHVGDHIGDRLGEINELTPEQLRRAGASAAAYTLRHHGSDRGVLGELLAALGITDFRNNTPARKNTA